MRIRRTGLAAIGTGLSLAVLVAVIGAAQAAAPATKMYSAKVHVHNKQINLGAGTATLTLLLKNESKITLGSANFDPPDGVMVTSIVQPEPSGWDIGEAADETVTFRSTTPLSKGQSVSANVVVSITSACNDATWTTRAKQSNDFSGNPGNDFQRNDSLSNLRPLGSFTFDPIGTTLSNQFYPQIKVDEPADVAVTAKDICGAIENGYGSGSTAFPGNDGDVATVDRDPSQVPQRLVGAVPIDISWASGVGSGTLTPSVVEAGDRLVVTDQVSGITAPSDAGDELDDFDVVETICTSAEPCHWDNSNGKIDVDAVLTADGASLGVGFVGDAGFSCNNETDGAVGDTLIYVIPRNYELGETQSVTFTFDKTLPGTSGSVSNFDVCISKDNGQTWLGPIAECESDPPVSTDPTPCVQDRGRSNGNLVIVLFLDPALDPLGGIT